MKLFVCEKPSQLKKINEVFNKKHMGIIAPSINSYKFNYEELKYSNAPYTNKIPKYKYNYLTEKQYFSVGVSESINSKVSITTNEFLKNYFESNFKKYVIDFFYQFDEIIIACDIDHSGIRGIDFKFEKYFNLGKEWINFFEKMNITVSIMKITSFDEKDLKEKYENRENLKNSKNYKILQKTYINKDFFEYNYNLNAILFFNDILHKIDLKNEYDIVITKNHISFLFILKNIIQENNMNFNFIYKELLNKKIGSEASIIEILNNLLKLGLVKEKNKEIYFLSQKGIEFVSYLHKKTNDPYLNLRLVEDMQKLNVDDFQKKYEKYIYTVFSKQKRLLRK